MLVRLAFSTMLEADADVLLIDEVLAVGDAAFQQKCADAFHEMKREGKTIVLVTHEMSTVEEYCHRAMLIDERPDPAHRRPGEVGRHYLRAELRARRGGCEGEAVYASQRRGAAAAEAWIEDADGERATSVEHGGRSVGRVELEALRDGPGLGVAPHRHQRRRRRRLPDCGGRSKRLDGSPRLRAGDRSRSRPSSRTRWRPAATTSTAGSTGTRAPASPSTSRTRSTSSSSAASARRRGLVELPHEIEAEIESGSGAVSRAAVGRSGRCARSSGPSALGGGLRRFFGLLWLIAVTEFRASTSAPCSATCGR